MSVVIRNKPTVEREDKHPIYEYYGFIDSDGDFFLITESDMIVHMDEYFTTYNLGNGHAFIEEFLESEFDTTLVRAYKKNDFDILIDLK
jgi:hypothetical protein